MRPGRNDSPSIVVMMLGWPRLAKRSLMLVADCIMIPASLWLAFALKFDSLYEGLLRHPFLYVGVTASSVAVFAVLGLYRSVVRFISLRALLVVLAGTFVSAVSLWLMDEMDASAHVPNSVMAIYLLLSLVWVAGSRFVARVILTTNTAGRIPVIVYGAGDAGAQLAVALTTGKTYVPVAVVDDKRALQGMLIRGVPVMSPGDLPDLVQRYAVKRILLAIPSASRRRKAEVIQRLEGLGVALQTVPDMNDVVSGRAKVEDFRDIDVSDLLGRDLVPPDAALLGACIEGKVVMVTGAGGSIGSELCRQIVRLAPRRLILFDASELALYSVDLELRETLKQDGLSVDLVSLLGNAHHKPRIRDILQAFGVQTIYHAAAYKHVPIVERNMVEGVHNNVYSTLHSAEAALECGVETFVLVSTDKAVNPTNVMGSTKRLAEIVLQGLHSRGGKTRFCMVRFGNVLESSGSVVPLFKQQIRRGGPVTVTHPDVIRYFMTIPEAAQLVLQAGSMGKGGDVFVLDMGKPVRIADLARRMIQLSGLTVRDEGNPDGDIEIAFTGLRPAEKLYEELLIGKNVSGTEHPMILRAVEHSLPWGDVQSILVEIRDALDRADCSLLRSLLVHAVREYTPAEQMDDLVWVQQQALVAPVPGKRVTDLGSWRQRQTP